MWAGVFPAVTTKFTESDGLDHAEMERCFALQMEAGCDGIIVAGSLGEGPMLSHEEKLEVLKPAGGVAGDHDLLGRHPVLGGHPVPAAVDILGGSGEPVPGGQPVIDAEDRKAGQPRQPGGESTVRAR